MNAYRVRKPLPAVFAPDVSQSFGSGNLMTPPVFSPSTPGLKVDQAPHKRENTANKENSANNSQGKIFHFYFFLLREAAKKFFFSEQSTEAFSPPPPGLCLVDKRIFFFKQPETDYDYFFFSASFKKSCIFRQIFQETC